MIDFRCLQEDVLIFAVATPPNEHQILSYIELIFTVFENFFLKV